jgi:hypothetical protein
MSNSSLVDYIRISPNRTPNRKYPITRISIHCVVGQCTVETIGAVFAPTSRQASCNYGIGPDGRIGMYCEEKDRSWCTSSPDNDHRAITIETASDTYHPYAVKPAAYEALLDLCEDICRRNGKKKLVWISDKEKALAYKPAKDEMLLTVHRWFANKACPGEYLYSRHAKIAAEVTKRLGGTSTPVKKEETKTPTTAAAKKIKEGDLVSIKKGATYYDGNDIPSWVENAKWYVEEVSGSRVVINKSQDGKSAIMSAVNAKYLTVVKTTSTVTKTETFKPYTVKVTANALNVRDGAGTNHKVNTIIRDKGVYTIVEEKTVSGLKWGKLKSGAGWISLQHTKKI